MRNFWKSFVSNTIMKSTESGTRFPCYWSFCFSFLKLVQLSYRTFTALVNASMGKPFTIPQASHISFLSSQASYTVPWCSIALQQYAGAKCSHSIYCSNRFTSFWVCGFEGCLFKGSMRVEIMFLFDTVSSDLSTWYLEREPEIYVQNIIFTVLGIRGQLASDIMSDLCCRLEFPLSRR